MVLNSDMIFLTILYVWVPWSSYSVSIKSCWGFKLLSSQRKHCWCNKLLFSFIHSWVSIVALFKHMFDFISKINMKTKQRKAECVLWLAIFISVTKYNMSFSVFIHEESPHENNIIGWVIQLKETGSLLDKTTFS